MAGCVNWTAQHQLVTGSKLFCYQSWVSHVGYFHEGTASASARRLSITATGAMARCTLTSFQSTTTNRKKGPPPDQLQDNNRGDGGGQAMQLALHDLTGQSWVFHVGPLFFFWGGGERNTGTMRPVNDHAY